RAGRRQGVSAAPGARLLLVRLPGALPGGIGRGTRAPALGWPSGSVIRGAGVALAASAPAPSRGVGVAHRVIRCGSLTRDRHAAPGPPAGPGAPGAGALRATGPVARGAVLAGLAEVF